MLKWLSDPATVYVLSVVVGAHLNWVLQAFNKEAPWSWLEYWFRNHPGRSASAVVVQFLTSGAMVTSGALTGIGIGLAIYLGIASGLGVDASVNKGSRQPLNDKGDPK